MFVENSVVFIPYTQDGNRIWVDSRHIITFPVKDWTDKKLLSTDPLTRYVVEKYLPLDVTYYTVKNTTLALIPQDSQGSQNFQDEIEIDREINTLLKQGYFGYPFSWHELSNQEVVREVCQMWNINIVSDLDPTNWILQTDIDFGQSSKNWLREAVKSASRGDLPSYNLKPNFEFSEEYSRHYGWDFKDVVLKYCSYLALSQLSLTDDISHSVVIHPDLSVSIQLPSYEVLEKFQKYLLMYLNQGIGNTGTKKKQGVWNIERCDTLVQGVVRRWSTQQMDREAYPMVLTNMAGENILIDRSQKKIKYSQDNDYVLFGISEKKPRHKTLLTALREFYTKCHDDIEAVTLEKISEMSLEELLEIVPIEEGNKTYCFLAETLARLEKPENPLTRQTLPNLKNVEDRLRGLYDLGPLWGIFPEDQQHEIKVTGNVKVERQSVPEERRELVGNIFRVSAYFPDGRKIDLFDISLPMIELERIGFLRRAVESLWPTGFFFNRWNKAVWKNSPLESLEVRPVNPLLIQAADSIYDGNLAYEYLLKSSEKT